MDIGLDLETLIIPTSPEAMRFKAFFRKALKIIS